MKRLVPVLAYIVAGLTVVAAILTPFALMAWFINGIAALGLHVDPVYSGGEAARTITKAGYHIVVNRPVVPKAPLSGAKAFVQIAWEPASALPARIADEVDVDEDGRADLRASFAVPRDPATPLQADVTSLSPRVASIRDVARQSFACVIVRVGDRIVLRVPLAADSRRCSHIQIHPPITPITPKYNQRIETTVLNRRNRRIRTWTRPSNQV